METGTYSTGPAKQGPSASVYCVKNSVYCVKNSEPLLLVNDCVNKWDDLDHLSLTCSDIISLYTLYQKILTCLSVVNKSTNLNSWIWLQIVKLLTFADFAAVLRKAYISYLLLNKTSVHAVVQQCETIVSRQVGFASWIYVTVPRHLKIDFAWNFCS